LAAIIVAAVAQLANGLTVALAVTAKVFAITVASPSVVARNCFIILLFEKLLTKGKGISVFVALYRATIDSTVILVAIVATLANLSNNPSAVVPAIATKVAVIVSGSLTVATSIVKLDGTIVAVSLLVRVTITAAGLIVIAATSFAVINGIVFIIHDEP
jgi:hypothetical protein